MALPTSEESVPNRRPKSAAAFRTISEVADELDVPQHVLRFWETKFGQIRPLKRGGGRRYYRPEDVVLLQRIRRLLYDEGYTIKGVQRLLREGGRAALPPAAPAVHAIAVVEPASAVTPSSVEPAPVVEGAPEVERLRGALEEALNELVVLRALLKAADRKS